MDTTPPRPPALSLLALFGKFLRFGCLAFGGPVAQIAMLRQALVEEERWIDKARFNRLLAVLQILPGPEAHELCVHFGVLARGRIGGLLAGLGFMLPGFCLMLLVGWLYVGVVQGSGAPGGLLLGIQVAILAVILRAVVRIGQHVVEDRLLVAIALAAVAATLVGVPFWIPLLVGGGVYAAKDRPAVAIAIGLSGIAAAIAALTISASAPVASAAAPLTILALFIAGLKGGLLTFGGAYTAVPYVRADTVGRGWIGDAAFLDGVAFANVIPAPLVIFATFVGYVAGGIGGALAITLGMFLPAFAFSLLFFERLEGIVDAPSLRHALTGVAAAVVGIIAATFVQLGVATGARVDATITAAVLFAVALAMAWRLKGGWVTPAVVAVGAVVGWALL
ncbi:MULTISPECIES: chromate efflux transporter [unclassified Sphingomonas]|uniref:chromate efflux transporter n=1 Tax=unclassified Sphingomonas TaxID=196159 RepID=UPI0006F34C09|nr:MULTISPECIES: chromate efflux transporter [unclassified Sphingomonas]KQM28711.1 chromate transporter [Sphingomonas sp. Leaf9]KQM45414.1 chromate transporter [Sphingomonas sp. Leaf11]